MAETKTPVKPTVQTGKPTDGNAKKTDPTGNDGHTVVGGVTLIKRAARKPSNIDPNETKAARFKRLVNFRVPKAIKAIRSIGLLGNSQQYEFTPEQVAIVIGLLTDEVKAAGRRFEAKTGAKEVTAIL